MSEREDLSFCVKSPLWRADRGRSISRPSRRRASTSASSSLALFFSGVIVGAGRSVGEFFRDGGRALREGESDLFWWKSDSSCCYHVSHVRFERWGRYAAEGSTRAAYMSVRHPGRALASLQSLDELRPV